MAGLIIAEPTTALRDWARTALDLPTIWAGGWPQDNDAVTGIVLEAVGSTLNVAVTTWQTQWTCWVRKDGANKPGPEAASLAGRLATLLVETAPRTLIGTTDTASVLYGGAVEGTVNLFPAISDEEDVYGHTLLVDLSTIAVPTP